MTIVFAANEDVSFLRSGATTFMSTLAGTFDSLTCRASLYMFEARRFEGTWDSAQANFWYQGRYWYESPTNGFHVDPIVIIRKGTTEILRIRHTASVIRVDRNDGTWTEIINSGTNFATATMQRMAMEVQLHASTGLINLYLDESLIGTFSGDTVGTTGETDADGIVLESSADATNGFLESYLTEVMVDTEDPRTKRLVTLVPTADGNDVAWDGTFADIDELELSDNDLLQTAVVDEVENFVTTDINAAWADFYPEEVRVHARVARAPGGPQNIQLHLRRNGVNYFSPSQSPGMSFSPLSYGWVLDPDTAAVWTNVAVDELQHGLKSIA